MYSFLSTVSFIFVACSSKQLADSIAETETNDTSVVLDDTAEEAYRRTQTISYYGVEVDVIIDKPEGTALDALVVYHGTVWSDSQIHTAATLTLNEFDRIVDREDVLLVSVVYPEENLIMGSNIVYAEAALLWVQNEVEAELGIDLGRVFLGGHSQGGYLVTRLNTMHSTAGVIANSPGPLDMRYRCQQEEEGAMQVSNQCQQLLDTYGSTAENPEAYDDISLLSFTSGHKAPLLLIQGMADADIQLHSWPVFTEQMMNCSDCATVQVVEVSNVGHPALFESRIAIDILNDFIQ